MPNLSKNEGNGRNDVAIVAFTVRDTVHFYAQTETKQKKKTNKQTRARQRPTFIAMRAVMEGKEESYARENER